MKKICYVTTISDTLKAFVLDSAKYLHENGNYDITFICDYDQKFADTLPEYIHYIPVPMKRGISVSGFKTIFRMRRIFKNEKFDLVQYSTPNASFYSAIAAKSAKIPVRLYCQWGIAYVGYNGIKRNVLKIIEKIICYCSTWIEPDSFGNRRFSIKEGLYKKDKSSVVWHGSANGVNLKKFNINCKNDWAKIIKTKYQIPDNYFILGFIGRITRDKGINELLRATKDLLEIKDNVILLIIGEKESNHNLELALLEWAKNEKRIIFCGWTCEVEKYIAAMDVLILPSHREGFGSVVIEAGAMGVPSIVTDIPGPTDVVENGETGIVVKKGDYKDFLRAILKLEDDRKSLEYLGETMRRRVTERYNQEELMKYIFIDRETLLNKR
ncbi:MAG: glycosyltransferase family 4 protein [Acetivibrionales bacterium]